MSDAGNHRFCVMSRPLVVLDLEVSRGRTWLGHAIPTRGKGSKSAVPRSTGHPTRNDPRYWDRDGDRTAGRNKAFGASTHELVRACVRACMRACVRPPARPSVHPSVRASARPDRRSCPACDACVGLPVRARAMMRRRVCVVGVCVSACLLGSWGSTPHTNVRAVGVCMCTHAV